MGYVRFYAFPQGPTTVQLAINNSFTGTTWRDYSLFYAYNGDMTTDKMTVGWFWYLVIDYQCFMLVPLIMMSNWFHRLAGLVLTLSLVLFSIVWSFTKLYTEDLNSMMDLAWDHYYYNFICRSCMYFTGCAVALFSIKNKKSEKKSTESQERKLSDTFSLNLEYEIRPTETTHNQITKEKRKKKNSIVVSIIGLVSLAIIIGNVVVQHYYFQFGHDTKSLGTLVYVLWTVFGKYFFVCPSMIFLIQLCKAVPKISKVVSKNAVIQLLGN